MQPTSLACAANKPRTCQLQALQRADYIKTATEAVTMPSFVTLSHVKQTSESEKRNRR